MARRWRALAGRVALAGLACATLAACDVGGGDTEVRFGGDAPLAEDDVHAIRSRDGTVRMGLTRDELYVRLSDEVLADVDREMAEETEGVDEGLAGTIARTVTGAVSRGLRTSIGVDVDRIDAIEYADGRIVLVGAEDAFEHVEFDDEPVLEKFAEDDVRALSEAFRRRKAGDPEG